MGKWGSPADLKTILYFGDILNADNTSNAWHNSSQPHSIIANYDDHYPIILGSYQPDLCVPIGATAVQRPVLGS